MAKVKLYSYTVEGHHRFPLDMLRYDRCWPAKQIDVSALDAHPGVRTVGVRSNQPPTVERWASFGWQVSNLKVDTSEV